MEQNTKSTIILKVRNLKRRIFKSKQRKLNYNFVIITSTANDSNSYLSKILLHKLGSHNPDESSSGMISNSFGKHCFASSRGAI